MIQVIKTGRNPTMRHLHRVHRVSAAWLHERLGPVPGRDDVALEYTKSEDMRADIYTKHFTNPDKWVHACSLISALNPSSVSARPRSSATTQRERTRRTAAAGLAAPACATRHAPGPAAFAPSQRPRPPPCAPGSTHGPTVVVPR